MNKIYGISDVIKHPDGWSYIVAFLDETKDLGNSKILCSWDNDSLDEMNV